MRLFAFQFRAAGKGLLNIDGIIHDFFMVCLFSVCDGASPFFGFFTFLHKKTADFTLSTV